MNLKWAVCTNKTKQNITKSFACLMGYTGCKDRSVHAPSQWEMTLHCNVFSHLLGAYMKWSLWMYGLFSVSLKKVQMSHVITLINSLSPSRCVKKILKFNNFGNYFYIFTRGQFWPSGIVVACVCVCVCVCVSVCLSVCVSITCLSGR